MDKSKMEEWCMPRLSDTMTEVISSGTERWRRGEKKR